MSSHRSRTNRLALSLAGTLLTGFVLALGIAGVTTPVLAAGASDETLSDDSRPVDDSAAYIRDLNGGPVDVRGDRIDGLGHPVRNGDDNVVVPEPGTLVLLGLGLAAVGVARRRRRA